MAQATADGGEQRLAVQLGDRGSSGHGRCGEPQENGEGRYVSRVAADILGGLVEGAARYSIALVGEDFVGYAHLHVVGLAREDQERFILRFPTGTHDAAIVAADVECAS